MQCSFEASYRYSAEHRHEYQRYLEQIDREFEASDQLRRPGAYNRLRLVLDLLDLGIEPVDAPDGLLIEGRIVLAVQSRKFRYVRDRLYRWYWYSELPALIAKITAPEPERPTPADDLDRHLYDQMFDTILATEMQASLRDFMVSLRDFWLERGFLSRRQIEVIQTELPHIDIPGHPKAKPSKPAKAKKPKKPKRSPGRRISRNPDNPLSFSPGQPIFHAKFGYGTVIQFDGVRVTADFVDRGVKSVMGSFVEHRPQKPRLTVVT